MATEYLRLMVKGAGDKRACSFWCELLADKEKFMLVRRVNKYGEYPNATENGVEIDDLDIISKGSVRKRQAAVMSRKYAELVVDDGTVAQ